MIIGNYTSYTKYQFCEIVHVVSKCSGQPLSIKYDFWNGLDNERYRQFKSNYHKGNNSFLCTNFLPRLLLHTLLIDTVEIFANTFHLSSKYSHKKRSLFHELFFNFFNPSTPPCWTLFSNGKECIGKFSSNNLFALCWILSSPIQFTKVSLSKGGKSARMTE